MGLKEALEDYQRRQAEAQAIAQANAQKLANERAVALQATERAEQERLQRRAEGKRRFYDALGLPQILAEAQSLMPNPKNWSLEDITETGTYSEPDTITKTFTHPMSGAQTTYSSSGDRVIGYNIDGPSLIRREESGQEKFIYIGLGSFNESFHERRYSSVSPGLPKDQGSSDLVLIEGGLKKLRANASRGAIDLRKHLAMIPEEIIDNPEANLDEETLMLLRKKVNSALVSVLAREHKTV